VAGTSKVSEKRRAQLREGWPLRKKVTLPTGQVVYGVTVKRKMPKTSGSVKKVKANIKNAGQTIRQEAAKLK
jgi:hypothetical protein